MAIMDNDRILVLGGDTRLAELAKIFRDMGYEVSTYGHEKLRYRNIIEHETLEEGVTKNNIIVAPVPFNSGDKLNMKLSDKTVSLEAFMHLLESDKKLYLGSPDSYFTDLAHKAELQYSDYNKAESFQILNAGITAEGTVSIIIDERDTTIHGSNIMVLGYGRIGKMLSNYLKVFGSNIYVAARKNEDIAWINLMGCKGVKVDNIDCFISIMDIVINTIPASILSNTLIDKMRSDALIIDLASKPGGLDHNYALKKGIKAIHALGLPGKTAPKSAARAIFEAILILH